MGALIFIPIFLFVFGGIAASIVVKAFKEAKQKQTDKEVSQAFSSRNSAKSEQSGLTD